MDCVRTSVREGAKSIKCLYRRDENTMPGSKKEVVNAKEEGVEFVFNVSPTKIISSKGVATGVELIKTKLDFTTSKRGNLINVAGSEYVENADVIIYTLGFDAVFVGIGATKGKTAGLDGENASNVHLAMEFLTAIQKRNFGMKVENFIDVRLS